MTSIAKLQASAASGAFFAGEEQGRAASDRDRDRSSVGAPGPLRVLVVEDELLIALTLESLVEDFGHEVCGAASTGEEAVELALALKPDLILMDIRLGGEMDGIEAAERVTRSLQTRVVFITAYGSAGVLERIRRAAPTAEVLQKPVVDHVLRAAINRAAGH